MMRPTSMRFRPRPFRVPIRACLAGLFLSALVSGGCAERNAVKARVKTFPWGVTAQARPIVPQLVNASYDQADLPESELDVTPPPSPLVIANGVPARPRVPVASPSAANPEKFEPPTIVPQLTAEEAEAAQQQTNLSLSIAERNIGSTRGRTLNATQSDLVSKVRSFVSEAREAAHSGDWTRASNAAKKAQVLSEELARSL
jgi:hypothetical protein